MQPSVSLRKAIHETKWIKPTNDVECEVDTQFIELEHISSAGMVVQMLEEVPGLVQDTWQEGHEMLGREAWVEASSKALPFFALDDIDPSALTVRSY